jgi:hypothetical protein
VRFQILLCGFGGSVIREGARKYVVGIHPKVSFVHDDGVKAGLTQRLDRLVCPHRIFKVSNLEIYQGRRPDF